MRRSLDDTSAFDLPARLAPKADPTLIAGDEQRFTAIAESLDESIADLFARLDALRRSPGGLGQAAMDRDMEIHRVTARLRTLRRFGLDVCLGHMVSDEDPDPVYVGRLGLMDSAGHQLLIDWRTPAAEPFFGATHANPMGLTRRRRYRWTRGRISDYWDEVFTADGLQPTPHSMTSPPSSPVWAATGRPGCATCSPPSKPTRTPSSARDRAAFSSSTAVPVPVRPSSLCTAPPTCSTPIPGSVAPGAGCCSSARTSPTWPTSPTFYPVGEEGVQTCTLRDLVTEGAGATVETDPHVARLKASAGLVEAIETAVRFYEEPPTKGMTVTTEGADIPLSAGDWAEAFHAPETGTPHNEARDQIWEVLLTILMGRYHGDVPAAQLRKSLRRNEELRTTLNNAWTLVEPADLVADLWSVPAYLRKCAPWLSSDDVRKLQRADAQNWTVSDLPLLDAARQRLGDPAVSRRLREYNATVAAERERMDRVVDNLIAGDDSELLVMSMLRGEDLQDALVDETALPRTDPDLLAGPFAHIVVDEAQELTDAEWQMLLRRCPSRSFTIVGDRAQARHGFTESWQERLERVGLDRINLASLSINYRTPEEVMAEAEPVIRAVLPDANVPTSIRSTDVPVLHGAASELGSILDTWLAVHAEGIGCVIGDPTFQATSRVQSLTPELSKGLEFDLVVLVDPDAFGTDIQGAVDRYVAMTRATQQLVILRNS